MNIPEYVKNSVTPTYYWFRSKRADWRQSNERGTPESSPFDSVLVICIDALRPDSTPELPLSWDHAITPAPWTFPAVTGFLSGQYPSEHGAVAHTSPNDDSFAMPEQASPERTLPQSFADAGFDTLGLFSFPIPFMASEGWFQKHRVWSDEPVETLVEYYRNWQRGRNRSFAYLHLGDLHAPIEPPERYVEKHDVDTSLPNLPHILEYTDDYDPADEDCRYYREQRLRLYAAAREYLEDTLNPLLSQQDESTLVVVFGDHGEAQWEHTQVDKRFTDSRPNYGTGHGGTPLDTVARVPVGSNRITPPTETTSLIDVPKTVLDVALDREIEEYDGVSWEEGVSSRPVRCEGSRYGAERKAVYLDDRKLIRSEQDDVTLQARITESGEEFGADIDIDDLRSALPEDWDTESQAETGRLVEGQLKALGYK